MCRTTTRTKITSKHNNRSTSLPFLSFSFFSPLFLYHQALRPLPCYSFPLLLPFLPLKVIPSCFSFSFISIFQPFIFVLLSLPLLLPFLPLKVIPSCFFYLLFPSSKPSYSPSSLCFISSHSFVFPAFLFLSSGSFSSSTQMEVHREGRTKKKTYPPSFVCLLISCLSSSVCLLVFVCAYVCVCKYLGVCLCGSL